MSKQIVINSENGAENIRLSRLATRDSNLSEDQKVWKILETTPCNAKNPALIKKTLKNGRSKLVKDRSLNNAMSVGEKITSHITLFYADDFGIESPDEVTLSMIQIMAKKYSTWPKEAQLRVCRDPSRQSIDEEVQLETLKKYLEGTAKVEKITNGSKTLIEGTIRAKDKKSSVSARSIDFEATKDNTKYYIFAKYVAVGGSGQGHQINESKLFVEEAKKYLDNPDNKDKDNYFIVLTDGKCGESHLPEMNEIIGDNYSRIFAGNCKQVINFIK